MPDGFHAIDEPDLAKDMVVGAEDIAVWLFGSSDKARRVYYLAEKSRLPTFAFGRTRIAIRKSVVRAFYWAKERRAFRNDGEEYSEKVEQLVRLGVLLPRLAAILEAEANRSPFDRIDPDRLRLWMLIVRETLRATERVLKGE
jgi:hypothetical protein